MHVSRIGKLLLIKGKEALTQESFPVRSQNFPIRKHVISDYLLQFCRHYIQIQNLTI